MVDVKKMKEIKKANLERIQKLKEEVPSVHPCWMIVANAVLAVVKV